MSTSPIPFFTSYGSQRQVETILKHVPAWWNVTTTAPVAVAESTPTPDTVPAQQQTILAALLTAIGRADGDIGGDALPFVMVSGTGTVTPNTNGTFTVTCVGAQWEPAAFVNKLFEDANRTLFTINSNEASTLRLAPRLDGTTPLAGLFNVLELGSAIQAIRQDQFVRTARGYDLDILARNLGVFRPRDSMKDDNFRALIPLLSWEPKQTRVCIEQILTALLGVKGTDWDCYEINNREIIVEVSGDTTLPPNSATYLMDSAKTANGPVGYMITDANTDKPDGALGTIVGGELFTSSTGVTLDATLIKQLLAKYARAAGVRVTVVFFGA